MIRGDIGHAKQSARIQTPIGVERPDRHRAELVFLFVQIKPGFG